MKRETGKQRELKKERERDFFLDYDNLLQRPGIKQGWCEFYGNSYLKDGWRQGNGAMLQSHWRIDLVILGFMKLKNHGSFGLVSEEKKKKKIRSWFEFRKNKRLGHDLSSGLCSSEKKERNVVCYFIIYYEQG